MRNQFQKQKQIQMIALAAIGLSGCILMLGVLIWYVGKMNG